MQKYVHIIGVCGVTMAPLAVLYKNMGWKVTGSDRAFFPPMSAYLEKNSIKIMPGFKAEHLKEKPNFVLAMAFVTEKNPEIIEARKRKIPIKVYADVLPKLIEKENSIIVAGDCGKTSTTALVAWFLESAGYNPNFMIGGLPKNFEHGIQKTNSDWSVMEGDEYPASSWTAKPRFFFYKPKYLILTDVRWDHMDKYPTEKIYIDTFKSLVRNVPKRGVIIANKYGENIKTVVKSAKAPVIFYEASNFSQLPTLFKGDIWRQNFAAAITLCKHIGIKNKDLKDAARTFRGIKRRQEVRLKKRNVVIVDDNAHTPIKVKGGLDAISEMFPKYDMCVIYEPGNRNKMALNMEGYKTCFKKAKYVILPRVSFASEDIKNFNKKLWGKLNKYYKNCKYIDEDSKVVFEIKKLSRLTNSRRAQRKLLVVFMSQKGFRGMIEEAISLLQ